MYQYVCLYQFLVFLKAARILIERSRKTLRSPKRISPKKRVRIDWTREEDAALVQFIALHGDVAGTAEVICQGHWPSTKNEEYWEQASKFVREATSSATIRPGIINCSR